MQTGDTDFIYRNELDKACFKHDMAYCMACMIWLIVNQKI